LLDQKLALHCCDHELDRLRTTLDHLQRREVLIASCTGQYLECPEMSCLGVGYTGRQTVMCFICENQWQDPNFGLKNRLWNWVQKWFPERIDGASGWRPCPHCGAAIVKNGGCDNMRCSLCDSTFMWGSFQNTKKCFAPHAPPSNRPG
jgi:hypothetical protein